MLTLRPILLPRHLASAVSCRLSDPVLKLAGLQWEQHLVEEAVCSGDRTVEGEEEKMEVREEREGTKERKREEERGRKEDEEEEERGGKRKRREEKGRRREEKERKKKEEERGWKWRDSLVPRPHPLTRRNGLVNQVEFLGLAGALATV